MEEVDELWDEIKKNQRDYDLEAQRKEAKQAAAMLCRLMVELLTDDERSVATMPDTNSGAGNQTS